jgi:ABC-type uncharacterized transport system permease subunit
MEAITSFLPLMILQGLYAIFTYKVAEKTNNSKLLYVFVTLIPGIGSVFFFIQILSSIIYCLDKIQKIQQVK